MVSADDKLAHACVGHVVKGSGRLIPPFKLHSTDRRRTVSRSTTPSVFERHALMQPRQKACSQLSRPNFLAPADCFSSTRSRQMPHSMLAPRARAARRSCRAVHSSACAARSLASVGCSACLPHTCDDAWFDRILSTPRQIRMQNWHDLGLLIAIHVAHEETDGTSQRSPCT